jgi:hypothetical protein
VRISFTLRFRDGFYVGAGLAIIGGVFLIWLWQADRQVSRHSESLLRDIAAKDWAATASLLGSDYGDQWGNDRERVLDQLREVFRYIRNPRLNAVDPTVTINGKSIWRARIQVDGEGGEAIAFIKDRINSLTTPFELEWRHVSGKPWDWKLVRVSNPELKIPSGFE